MTAPAKLPAAHLVCEGASRERWLELRRDGLGGSDIAAILGLSPFASPYSVWQDKVGIAAEKEQSERMRWGQLLEDPVRQAFSEETGHALRRLRPVTMYGSDELPRAYFTPDSLVGRRVTALLEIKTTDLRMAGRWQDEETGEPRVPPYYEAQCQWGAAVLGLAEVHLAVLIGGNDLRLFHLEADPELGADLFDQAEAFLRLVDARTPPDPDGSPATTEAIRRALSVSEPESVHEADDTFAELVSELRAAKAFTSLAHERQAAIENRLKMAMGDAEVARRGERTLCTFRSSEVAEHVVKACRRRTLRLAAD